MYCEDYPCCGHTENDPCPTRPGAVSLSDPWDNPHYLCDHENGDCEVWDEDEEESEADFLTRHGVGPDYDPEEDQWLDGSYEE